MPLVTPRLVLFDIYLGYENCDIYCGGIDSHGARCPHLLGRWSTVSSYLYLPHGYIEQDHQQHLYGLSQRARARLRDGKHPVRYSWDRFESFKPGHDQARLPCLITCPNGHVNQVAPDVSSAYT